MSRLNLYWFNTLATWIPGNSGLFVFVGFILMLVGGAFLKNPVQISGPKKTFQNQNLLKWCIILPPNLPKLLRYNVQTLPIIFKTNKTGFFITNIKETSWAIVGFIEMISR